MSDDTQETITVDEVLANQFGPDGEYRGNVEDITAQRVLSAEVRRLRELFGNFQLECCDDWTCAQDHARKGGEVIAELRSDRDQLSASNLRLVAEREQFKSELAANEACYQNRLEDITRLAAERDGARAERDKLKAEVERQKWMRNDSREQGKSLVEHLQTENAKLRDALVFVQEQYRNTVSSLRIVTAEAELRLPR